jgi:hypothetical protein
MRSAYRILFGDRKAKRQFVRPRSGREIRRLYDWIPKKLGGLCRLDLSSKIMSSGGLL